jgi:hypothetical protein
MSLYFHNPVIDRVSAKVIEFGGLPKRHRVRSIRVSEVTLKVQDVHSSNYEMSILNIRTLVLDVAVREYLLYMTEGSDTPRSDNGITNWVPHYITCKYFTLKEKIMQMHDSYVSVSLYCANAAMRYESLSRRAETRSIL